MRYIGWDMSPGESKRRRCRVVELHFELDGNEDMGEVFRFVEECIMNAKATQGRSHMRPETNINERDQYNGRYRGYGHASPNARDFSDEYRREYARAKSNGPFDDYQSQAGTYRDNSFSKGPNPFSGFGPEFEELFAEMFRKARDPRARPRTSTNDEPPREAKRTGATFVADWREILGLSASGMPSKDEIMRAYRAKAKQCHPDNGGKHDDMVKLNQAKDYALQTIGA